MESRDIALHYLRGWFIPDFVVVLCDWAGFFMQLLGEANDEMSWLLSVSRMFRLIKLVRIAHFARVYDNILRRFGFSMTRNTSRLLQMGKLILGTFFFCPPIDLLLVCHWKTRAD